jgi:putative endonuclease
VNYTYILKCSDGSFYTGWTTNIERRLKEHNSGKGARYTRARLPVELVHFEVYETKSDAMKRECEIKSMPRRLKIELMLKSKIK